MIIILCILFVINIYKKNIYKKILILFHDILYTIRYCYKKTLKTVIILLDKYINYKSNNKLSYTLPIYFINIHNYIKLINIELINIFKIIKKILFLCIIYLIIKIIYI